PASRNLPPPFLNEFPNLNRAIPVQAGLEATLQAASANLGRGRRGGRGVREEEERMRERSPNRPTRSGRRPFPKGAKRALPRVLTPGSPPEPRRISAG